MENVLFLYKAKDSPVKIIDFRLSESVQFPKNLIGMISGKKNYNMTMVDSVVIHHLISPEVLEGKYNQKCDLWSAGVI